MEREQIDNALNDLVKGGTEPALILALWQQRMVNPELNFKITPKDIKGLYDCTEYLKITPAVRIFRPGGLPAVEARPAVGRHPATAGRPAIPYADYVMVQLVAHGTTDAFKPVENNEADFDASEKMNKVRRLKETVPQLASIVRSGVARGQYSESEITELCEAATMLARA
jgi:hypothetical protein